MFAEKKLSKAINPDSHCSAPYLRIVQLVGCSFGLFFCGKPDSPEPSAANMYTSFCLPMQAYFAFSPDTCHLYAAASWSKAIETWKLTWSALSCL